MKSLIANALANLPELADMVSDLPVESTIERTRDPESMVTSPAISQCGWRKPARMSPRDIAAKNH